MRTIVSPSGKVEVKWPWILGGRWKIIVNELEMMKGIRWPGKRRARWLVWGLDATAEVLAIPPARFTEVEEVEQLSREVGKPKPDSNPLGLRKGTPPTDAALDCAKALGWSERASWTRRLWRAG